MAYRILEALMLISAGGLFGLAIGVEPVIGSILFMVVNRHLRG